MTEADIGFYTGTLMNVAFDILKNNQQRYGPEFSNAFITDHDLNNGPQTHRLAASFHNYVVSAMQAANGTPQATNEQLFMFVGKYIEEIFNIHVSNTQRQRGMSQPSFGNGFSQPSGGFGRQPNGFGNSGGFNNSGFGQTNGFSPRNQQRPGSSSSLRDDSIAPIAPVAPVVAPTPVSPVISPTLSTVSTSQFYTHNPLDNIQALKEGVKFESVPESPNWGIDPAVDDSIVVMKRESWKTEDDKYVIRQASGFSRIYTNNELDVVNDFFRVVPSSFVAENYVVELFYNHVEVIDIPTKLFLEVQSAFLNALKHETTAYRAVLSVLDTIVHGPRMAMANYLVEHINRGLYKCCRMSERPSIEITFTQIEDLKDLLGASFNHRILELPNARTHLQDIVNNSIKAALSGYTTPMFTSNKDAMMSDIIRTSAAFPFAIEDVYPTKTIIPSYGDNTFDSFYQSFSENVLEHKTYVRSIRSAVVSNLFGGNELAKITKIPVRIFGVSSHFLAMFRTDYKGSIGISKNDTEPFDEQFNNDIPEKDYVEYLENPQAYLKQMKSRFTEIDTPRYPVDRTLYAVQFKKSPKEYIKAIDFITSLDEPKENNSGIFVAKDIPTLNLVK
jgi:hypothetical protein